MSGTINFAIDLGTTNSLIAKSSNGNVDIFKNPAGMKMTLPSVVAFRKDRILIGDKAREYVEKDAANVFAGFKRKMGTSESFFIPNSAEFKTPIELSTLVLQELRNFIFTGETPESVVITIPASFDTIQSNATKEAGYAAGFKEVVLLQEPIAASLAFANKEGKSGLNGQWLVYDLGGGTFDVALVKIDEDEMKVVDHEGDNFLGGLDFDQLIITRVFVPYLEQKFPITDLATKMLSAGGKYNKLYYQLLYRAEEAKIALSNYPSADIEFDFTDESGEEHEVFFTMDRSQLDDCIKDKIVYSISFIQRLLERNNLTSKDIAEVVLVGGSTYIPLVRTLLNESLQIAVNTSIDPTTAVVEGAAWYAGGKTSRLDKAAAAQGQAASKAAAASGIEVKMAYQATSRDSEEYFAASLKNVPPGSFYRITRGDGGMDSGLKPAADRISEMLALVPNAVNNFHFKLYDSQGASLPADIPEIYISQGRFSIFGQPLPNDICLEVDDIANNTTHLEVIFERNAILPIRKSVTKTLSRTITRGSDDQLLINVVEGSRYASPQSNLTIGVIAISGKDLTADLIKGCDIDLTFEVSESRDITVNAYISMADLDFKEVFSPSARTVNVVRMQEETDYLQRVGRRQLDKLLAKELYEESSELQLALTELEGIQRRLKTLPQDDVTDTKYQLDDHKRRIAQVIDSVEKGEGMQVLKEEYFGKKAYLQEFLEEKKNPEMQRRFDALTAEEGQWINHCSRQFLRLKINELNTMTWEAKKRDIGFVTAVYMNYAMKPDNQYENISEIRALKKRGDEALTRQNVDEILAIVYRMYELLIDKRGADETIKGTGLG